MDQNRYAEAIKAFDETLKIDPNDELALAGKVACLRALRDFEAAERAVEDALAKRPNSPAVLNERAFLFFDQGVWTKALEAFDKTLNIDPNNEMALAWKIAALRALRDFEAAERAVEDALARRSKSPSVLSQCAALFLDQREWAKARDAFDETLDIDPNDELALAGKVACLRGLRDFEAAERAVEDALAERPNSPAVLNERAFLFFDQGGWAKARDAFDKTLDTDPNDELALAAKVNCLRVLRDFEAAERAVEDALAKRPKSPAILNQRAFLFFDQRVWAKALEAFDKTLNVDPNNEMALDWKIAALRTLGNFEEAQRVLQNGLAKIPKSAALRNERGLILIDQNRPAEAIKAFDETLKIDPKNEVALDWKIAALRTLGNFEEAQRVLQDGLAKIPKSAALRNERSLILMDQNRPAEAIKAFDEVLDIDPKNEVALQSVVTCLRRLRDFEAAERAVEDALAKHPRSPRIQNERGWLHFDEDRFEQAEADFAAAAQLDPHWVQPVFDRAKALVRMGRYTEAIAALKTLKDSKPGDPTVLQELGFFYIDRNELSNAEREFHAVLERDPASMLGLNGLASVRFTEGHYEEAEDRYRKLSEGYSHLPVFRANLAWALVRQDDQKALKEAASLCHEVLRRDPKNHYALNCLGVIAYKHGHMRDSEEFLRRSIEANPRDGGAYRDLGALYAKLGRHEDAKTYLEKAIQINENDTQAHIELGNLCLKDGETKNAIRAFRRAVASNQYSEKAIDALAIALIWEEKKFDEAEEVLRKALERLDPHKRWRLHLTLSRLLTRIGAETSNQKLYEEALIQTRKAIGLERDNPDAYFEEGIIRCALERYKDALKSFAKCLECDENHTKAEWNRAQVEKLLRDKRRKRRPYHTAAILIATVAVPLLVLLWILFFFDEQGRITERMMIVFTPILLGLIVLAVLLPWIKRVKVPWLLELELMTEPKEMIASGPVGDVAASRSAAGSGLATSDASSSASGVIASRSVPDFGLVTLEPKIPTGPG